MHSKKYETVKKYYVRYIETDGRVGWDLHMVSNAVVKGWITEEEFEEITGQKYEAE